jgi:hypothetical protein
MKNCFSVVSSKNCVKYTKKTYSFDPKIDQSFVSYFSTFGEPEITEVKKYLPTGNDLLKIRNYDFSFEVIAGFQSQSITVTYKKEDIETINLVELELNNWIYLTKTTATQS